MIENVENLILEHLRAIRGDIGSLNESVRELKSRMTNLEVTVAGLRRDMAEMYAEVVGQHGRYDKLVERIERIEKRLELTSP